MSLSDDEGKKTMKMLILMAFKNVDRWCCMGCLLDIENALIEYFLSIITLVYPQIAKPLNGSEYEIR